MRHYAIMNAIARTGRNPHVPYSLAYEDYATFEAESDTQAVEIAKQLQRDHDKDYGRECGMANSFINRVRSTPDIIRAPCYAFCLYDISCGVEKRRRVDPALMEA